MDAAMLNLQIKHDGKGMLLPFSQQPIKDMNIGGFSPRIIRVDQEPVNLPVLLGVSDTK